jgi:hypothetical protein
MTEKNESNVPAPKVTSAPAPKPQTPDLNAVPPGTNEGFVLAGSVIPNVHALTKKVQERAKKVEKDPLSLTLSLQELYILVRHIRGSEGENFLNEVFNRSGILLY